MTPKSLVVTTK